MDLESRRALRYFYWKFNCLEAAVPRGNMAQDDGTPRKLAIVEGDDTLDMEEEEDPQIAKMGVQLSKV